MMAPVLPAVQRIRAKICQHFNVVKARSPGARRAACSGLGCWDQWLVLAGFDRGDHGGRFALAAAVGPQLHVVPEGGVNNAVLPGGVQVVG
ncbi:hypothetical protein ACFQO7_31970 [Catellatospora aurea]|uniref:Uncharacterized protein n=1 Tax=Catellatospora aurea TaxID=1337874 RepID=A0ABW2H824_9ACTN